MGFFNNIGSRVRDLLRSDKDQVKRELAKASTLPTMTPTASQLLSGYGYDTIADHLRVDSDLLSRYADYESMDDYPLTSTALDVFTDDATQLDTHTGRTLWVESQDKLIKVILEELFHKTLRMDEELWEIARVLNKFGNSFEELLVTKNGVEALVHLHPSSMRRVEGPRGELYGFIQDFKGRMGFSPEDFKNALAARIDKKDYGNNQSAYNSDFNQLVPLEGWEVVHWRLRTKHRRSAYGQSLLESSRWIFKRLVMLEDAAVIYRLQRAPERFAFYVDVGNMPPQESLQHMNRFRQQYKKTKYFNPLTGKLDMKYNAQPVAWDTPIPLLDGRVITIKEMAEEHKLGKKHWVYSIDRESKTVVPGEVSWVDKTREKAATVKITFDDGNYAKMAPDHPVMRRNGEYVQAKDLQPGDDIMPFYRKKAAVVGKYGYEQVYHPGKDGHEFTHRLVAKYFNFYRKSIKGGGVVHHKDFNKLNNTPENLEWLSLKEHAEIHTKAGHLGGKVIADLRKTDSELDANLREVARKTITRYNKSKEKSSRTTELNKKYDTAKYIRAYNRTEKHVQDNEIRRRNKKEFWTNPEKAAQASQRMRLKWPEELFAGIRKLVIENPEISAEAIVRAINSSELLEIIRKNNPNRKIKAVYRDILIIGYRSIGYNNFAEFKSSILNPTNHRVFKVEFIEEADLYCMTVEKWHNFALLLMNSDGSYSNNSGVFTKNSSDDDFFLAVPKDSPGNKVQVLGAPQWQSVVDIKYFQDMMFSALKIPKAYLGAEDGTLKQTLSSQDVRFARTILRIQRELKNGLSKIARVHLAALNMNPAMIDYDIQLTTPSSIFELAQIEVKNARAGFANSMKEYVSIHWMLSEIFGMNDEEIEQITKEREQDQVREAVFAARAQNAAQVDSPPIAPPAGPGGAPQPATESRKFKISEEELFKGSREAEKRASEKLDKLLKNDAIFSRRFVELSNLLEEIKYLKGFDGSRNE